MILHLGVIDQPYNDPKGMTTGRLARILENKYHIMNIFYHRYEKDIKTELLEAAYGSLESLLSTGFHSQVKQNPFATGLSEIEDLFKKFLASGELEHLGIPGIPTQASLDRRSGKTKSSRFKKKSKNSRTGPSFIDSGLYQSSFKAWID